ncbi:MAG: phnA [Verrucomicrobiaceae bacterium]|nr:phnA [Verrucomicrobiaceae bacterium]
MNKLLLSLGASAAILSSARALQPASERIVVLISVDGMAQYYLDDPKAEIPNIRRLAAEGGRAEMMKASMPTVTWPNHTTLVTGVNPSKHGVIGNSYFDREKLTVVPLLPDPLFNKEEIVKSPTIYDVAKAAGLKTAGLIWPASRGAPTLDWTVPDVGTKALYEKFVTPGLLAEFSDAGIPWELNEQWWKEGKGRNRDRMYVQMINHVIRHHRPNLALLHLVELDHVEHAKGPQSPEAYAALKFEDERVAEVWDELQKSFPGGATLIVSADHGFFPYQQQVQPNVLLRQEGLLKSVAGRVTGGQVRAVGQGGASFLYVLDKENREALITRLADRFKDVEGVQLVITPKDFAKYGMADPLKNPQMADLVLSAKKGYSFIDNATGEEVVTAKTEEVKGSHGYDPNEPGLNATFVACGAGIRAGVKLGNISNMDVAPTMATLLGIKMPDSDGQVLAPLLVK